MFEINYQLVEDNILVTSETISYIYRLGLVNTEFSSNSNSELLSNYLSNIIKLVNMPGQLYLLPQKIDPSEVVKYYAESYNASGVEKNESIVKEIINDTSKMLAKGKRYNYQLYLVFNQTDKKIGKKKINLFKLSGYEFSESQRKRALYVNEFILNILESNYDKNKVFIPSGSETLSLLNYLYLPVEDVEHENIIYSHDESKLSYVFEDTAGSKKKLYTTFGVVNEMPNIVDEYFDFIEKIQKFRWPVDTILHFNPNIESAKLEKQLMQQKNLIKKDADKYSQINSGSSLFENKQKINIASLGEKYYQDLNAFMIEFQLIFRIYSEDCTKMEERLQFLKKNVTSSNFTDGCLKMISPLGENEKISNHILPGQIAYSKYIHKVTPSFFSKLKLVSGIFIGMEKGLVVASTRVGDKVVLYDPHASMSGETKSSSTTTIVTGTTGSGKSQIVNNIVLLSTFVNGLKSLIIDPKGDRKGMGEKLGFPELITEIVIGTELKYKGTLDVFKHSSEKSELITKVSTIVKKLYKIDDENNVYKNSVVVEAIEEYLNSGEQTKSFKGFLQVLKRYDEDMYSSVSSFENQSYINLLFGDGTNNNSFDFSKELTVIIIEAPIINHDGAFDNSDIKIQLFLMILAEVESIIHEFLRELNGTPFSITLEEVSYYKNVSSSNIAEDTNKIIRSFGGNLNLISQNYSDFTEEIHNNTGSYFLGSVNSKKELNYIAEKINVDPSKISFLEINNEQEGLNEADQHNFIYVDPNNRKSRVKLRFLPIFQNAFYTHVKRSDKYEK